MTIKADLTNARVSTKNAASYRRENSFTEEYSYIDPTAARAPVTARFYCTKSTVYCCLWVFELGVSWWGCGKSGGYGHPRTSAAFAAAVEDAGIALSAEVSYVRYAGADGIEAAVRAIGDAITGGNGIVHHAHA